MLITPCLRLNLRPKLYSWVNQTRNVRPIIKLGKERFQLSLDVHQFTKEELRVKARAEYVIIEGKQERKTKNGCVMRQFVRKFKLPSGCNPNNIKSELNEAGCLTITAPRETCATNLPCETFIPIISPKKKEDVNNMPPDTPNKKCPDI